MTPGIGEQLPSLEELTHRPAWMARAQCRGEDTALFFQPVGASTCRACRTKTRLSHPRFASAAMICNGLQLLAVERDQLYLMPPSLKDWLPDDHLALFMIDVVDELDLSGLYEHYRSDGLGRAAYEPSVMVAVLLYAYCIGERSSRRIERRCTEDIAFRVLSANQVPDHASIARFVKTHKDALSALFCQVLVLCQHAGLVKLGVLYLDGTKIAASASGQANRTREDLEAETRRIVAEAITTDKEEEDARYGENRGDELPPDLRDPRDRRARIAQAKARLDAHEARRQAEYEERLAEKAAADRTRRGGGRPMKPKPVKSEL